MSTGKRLVPRIDWTVEGASGAQPLDPRVLALLEGIAATGSLAAARSRPGVSYRAGWGVLQAYDRLLGAPLVHLERGRGARLAPLGEALLEAHRRAERRTARAREALAIALPARSESRSALGRLAVSASHDLALAALRDAAGRDATVDIALDFKGSLEAVQDFAAGRVALAGFHVPTGRGAGRHWAPFARWLRPRRDRLIRFVEREQGLILPQRNPARVSTLAEVAARGLRFVNRQRGSGTRLLVDSLLARHHIDPGTVAGYGVEEFTHTAIAATVAAGRADVGFGIRAAASSFGLAFVPLVRERYLLAVRADALDLPEVIAFLGLLRSPTLAGILAGLPGYAAPAAGQVIELPTAVRSS